MRVLAWVVSNAIAIAVAAWLFDGIYFTGPTSGRPELTEKILPLLVVALIMGVVTAFVKPVMTILSIPFIILTLGLFLFVVNALMLLFVAWIADLVGIGFHVDGFWTAVGGAIVITVVDWVVDGVLGLDD
ncbi:phage holin family protein [Nocardioides taihuensis]|uniref:Phage holin family protein n=1 Tax=Nocardioides taihuensis TaxID=1835606 RepID=A0ABW0BGK3_9ACTN